MFLTSFLKFIRNRPYASNQWESDLPSPIQFGSLLRIEQYRADRAQDAFSLLKFSHRDPDSIDLTNPTLVKILRKRLRCTDEIGWLENQTIGVILPSTPSTGAAKLADDISLLFPTELNLPLCEIFTYPGNWPYQEIEVSHSLDETNNDTGLGKTKEYSFSQNVSG